MIVADNETAVDLLYYEAISKTVVRLISEASDQPLSVGIHGDWGAGKSSVLLMVEEAFEPDERTLCVTFNGWLFQGLEDAKAVLVETIVQELLDSRSGIEKVRDQARKVLGRVDWMKTVRAGGGVAAALATGIPTPQSIADLRDFASTVFGKAREEVTEVDLGAAAKRAGELLNEAETPSAPRQMHSFREEFTKLLDEANVDRLVVLVDDLDRCLPATAIDTLEAIRLFLFVPRATFVIAADEGMIEYAVRQHFPDLPVASGPATYARNYLEKLIQVPFRLPSLGYVETRVYVALLLVLNECGETSDEFVRLADVARSVLQRPWEGRQLSRGDVEEAHGPVGPAVERALSLANRIAPILTDGVRGNPRQVKRFVNAMSLRLAVADARGFADEIDETVLAKVMLVERFAPKIYDAIASSSAGTGRSEDLTMIERSLQGFDSDAEVAEVAQNVDGESQESLPEWPNLEWAKRWAGIDPPLSGHDLRPYIFVTRDHRELFGANMASGQLEELLHRLGGTPLQAQQSSIEVSRLPSDEAEHLFDELSRKVAVADDLKTKPAGIPGLVVVCQQHEFLQRPLVRFLSELPTAKLGPWVVGGWEAALSSAQAKTEFDRLRERWAEQQENGPLRAAAEVVRNVPRLGGRPR